MKEEQMYTNKHSQTKLANMVLKYQTGVLYFVCFLQMTDIIDSSSCE